MTMGFYTKTNLFKELDKLCSITNKYKQAFAYEYRLYKDDRRAPGSVPPICRPLYG